MSIEQQYARVLWHVMEKGKSLPEALSILNPVLVRRGHTTIVRKTIHALTHLAETKRRTDVSTLFVAREQDVSQAVKEVRFLTNNDTPSVKVDPTIMERNLYNRKIFPFFPTLPGVSAKIGPGVSSLIAIAVTIQIGR